MLHFFKNNNASLFLRAGCIVLLVLLILSGILRNFFPKTVQTLSSFISSATNTRKLPIYCVDTAEKKVALTFDAAWGNEDTADILSILKENDIKATFFMTGGWVEAYPDDVKAIAEAGHELGNHSENHKQMSALSAEQCQSEIKEVHDRVKSITGIDMTVFRPPYGDYNNTVIEAAHAMHYYPIQWSVDSLDWKDYGVESIITTVLEHKALDNGAIILMHNGAKYTRDALSKVISGLKEKGCSFVTVSELIYPDNYHIDTAGKQIRDE